MRDTSADESGGQIAHRSRMWLRYPDMPFSHAICAAEETVLVTANGEITIRSAQRAVSDVQADPQFRPDYRVLVDLREMKYSPSTEDIRVLASTLGEARDSYRGKVAVVVSGKFQFGMAVE
jgi:hypothetical protein